MKCYACCQARLQVTHTYDDGQVAVRRRRCPGCGLRVVTEERPATPLVAPAPRETLWILHEVSKRRVWLGFDWPEGPEAEGTQAEGLELRHLGRFVAVDAALEARFRAHFASAHLESCWYHERVAESLRRLLKLDPRGRLGSPAGGPR